MGAKSLTVAVDASPLIGLAKIRKLRLLAKLYPVVVIPPAVYTDNRQSQRVICLQRYQSLE